MLKVLGLTASISLNLEDMATHCTGGPVRQQWTLLSVSDIEMILKVLPRLCTGGEFVLHGRRQFIEVVPASSPRSQTADHHHHALML